MYEQIQHSVQVLRNGGTIIFPTETVYGLGADARNDEAIQKVFTIKNRPLNHPLIVHIATLNELDYWAINIPKTAKILAKAFWPGPLTLILPKQPHISNMITGGQNSIALRIPQHPITIKLLRQFGSGIVGTSANQHGYISPTSTQHIQEPIRTKVESILDGGDCKIGIESTIVDLSTDNPVILRKGAITHNDIFKLLGKKFIQQPTATPQNKETPSNFALKKPLYLVESTKLAKCAIDSSQFELNYSFLSFQPCPVNDSNIMWLQTKANPKSYAKNLYSLLHQLDNTNSRLIIAEQPPALPAWDTVIDKLTKASTRTELPHTIANQRSKPK